MTRAPTEMELRVAKALHPDWWHPTADLALVGVEKWRARAVDEARAAIRAMRFATPEMMQAGYQELKIGLPDCWLAMIQAASPP